MAISNKLAGLAAVGAVFAKRRADLVDFPKSRKGFIEEVANLGILEPGWISEKALANIETGKNLPSIETLCMLARALQVDQTELFDEVASALGYR